MENKAQISLELIIIMAALAALALFLISQLQDTSRSFSEQLETKTEDILTKIDEWG